MAVILNPIENATIVLLWANIAPHAKSPGAETLFRLFLSFPKTKTYFSHFDLCHGSADLQAHVRKVMNALVQAAQHLDSLDQTLSVVLNFRVDPGNFQLRFLNTQVVLAIQP
ncbi:hemoglobin subunit alpha-3-like [Discoglossus pictus]